MMCFWLNSFYSPIDFLLSVAYVNQGHVDGGGGAQMPLGQVTTTGTHTLEMDSGWEGHLCKQITDIKYLR